MIDSNKAFLFLSLSRPLPLPLSSSLSRQVVGPWGETLAQLEAEPGVVVTEGDPRQALRTLSQGRSWSR